MTLSKRERDAELRKEATQEAIVYVQSVIACHMQTALLEYAPVHLRNALEMLQVQLFADINVLVQIRLLEKGP